MFRVSAICRTSCSSICSIPTSIGICEKEYKTSRHTRYQGIVQTASARGSGASNTTTKYYHYQSVVSITIERKYHHYHDHLLCSLEHERRSQGRPGARQARQVRQAGRKTGASNQRSKAGCRTGICMRVCICIAATGHEHTMPALKAFFKAKHKQWEQQAAVRSGNIRGVRSRILLSPLLYEEGPNIIGRCIGSNVESTDGHRAV